jgi:hypothetical protein
MFHLQVQKISIKRRTTTINPIRNITPIVLPRNFNIGLLHIFRFENMHD